MMDDAAPVTDPVVWTRARWGRRTVVGVGMGVMIFAGTEYLAAALLERHPFMVTLPVSLLALIGLTGVLLGAGGVVYLARHWWWPLRRLRAAVEEARAGRLAIEQVPLDVGGL